MAGPSGRKGNGFTNSPDKKANSSVNQQQSQKRAAYNKTENTDPFVSDAMAKNSKQLLYAHIYNYFVHNRQLETAKMFLQEANVPLSRDVSPESLAGNKLLHSKMLMNSPETFLLEWWQSLWALNEYVETTPTETLTSLKPFSDRIVPILPQAPPREMMNWMVRSGSAAPPGMGVPNNIVPEQSQQQQHMRPMASPANAQTPYSSSMGGFPHATEGPSQINYQNAMGQGPSNTEEAGSPYLTTGNSTGNSKPTPKGLATGLRNKGKQTKKTATSNKALDSRSNAASPSTIDAKTPKPSSYNSNAKVRKPSTPASQQVQANWTKLQQQQQQQHFQQQQQQQQQVRMQYQKMMSMMQQQQQMSNGNVLHGQTDLTDSPNPSQYIQQQQRSYEDMMKPDQQ